MRGNTPVTTNQSRRHGIKRRNVVDYWRRENVNYTRRQWIIQGSTLALGTERSFSYQDDSLSALEDGAETERFRIAQSRALAKYRLEAQSRLLALKNPALKVHVLVAGRGDPLLLLHGGGAEAVNLAPLMSGLTGTFQCFAPDRPGC